LTQRVFDRAQVYLIDPHKMAYGRLGSGDFLACAENPCNPHYSLWMSNIFLNIIKFIDSSSNSIYDERAYQYLTPSPVPFLHRCRALTTDRTGRSLAALQYHPTTQ